MIGLYYNCIYYCCGPFGTTNATKHSIDQSG